MALFRGICRCAEDVERQGSYAPEIAQPFSSQQMNSGAPWDQDVDFTVGHPETSGPWI